MVRNISAPKIAPTALLEARAISVCHPDLATAGGILETKRIGDLEQEYGVSMAIHMAGSPVSTMAAVHCAAATENFIALEHHFADLPYWSDFVTGVPGAIIQDGYKPGCRLNHLPFCENIYFFGLHQEVRLRLGVDVVSEVPTDHFFYIGYLVLRVPLHQVVLSL